MRTLTGQFVSVPLEDRLNARIVKLDTCWLWKGKVDATGYGSFGMRENGVSRTRTAHKIVYETLVGPVPEGKVLDHTCHDPIVCTGVCPHRLCVNPVHLEIVTQKVNVHRSNGLGAVNAAKTHCKNGHEFTPENTYIHPSRGSRLCRTCRAESVRKYQHRQS